MNSKKEFTVSELNSHIRLALESDSELQDIWVSGEVTNTKTYHLGGQVYFTLSDGCSQINCVMYQSFLSQLKFSLENGISVICRGKIRVFHRKGQYVFLAVYISTKGAGLISEQLEKLKARLLKEGLFEAERKRPLPRFPEHIGLITSFNSAAMWDFISHSRCWMPHVELVIIPAIMQGRQSPPSIIEALQTAVKWGKMDVLVVLRGGGSSEDLASFNDEGLVREVASSPIPVLSAVGHEVDVSLVDFAADFRVATPTAAVETLAFSYRHTVPKIFAYLSDYGKQLESSVVSFKDQVRDFLADLEHAMDRKLEFLKHVLENKMKRVEAGNPLKKLKQGYSICRLFETGRIVKSISQIQKGVRIETRVQDGIIHSHVETACNLSP